MSAIETSGLGKRYGRSWALRDCTLAVPAGHVVALVGPNGAGKTTLLQMATGLTAPTTGRMTVLDGRTPGCPAALDGVGFVAQDASLYRNLSVTDMIRLGRSMNRRWDDDRLRGRLAALQIPLGQKTGRLSGGQRAQVALALALAKRPRLLILDEPVSSLDPLARHEFMSELMAAVSEDGLSVVLSSHVVAELERVCDYVVVMSDGRVQVAGEVETQLAEHYVLTGPADQADSIAERLPVVRDRRAWAQAHLLVRCSGRLRAPDGWEVSRVGLEELVLAYMRAPAASALPGPAASRTDTKAVVS